MELVWATCRCTGTELNGLSHPGGRGLAADSCCFPSQLGADRGCCSVLGSPSARSVARCLHFRECDDVSLENSPHSRLS